MRFMLCVLGMNISKASRSRGRRRMSDFSVISAQPWHCGQMIRRLRREHHRAVSSIGIDSHRELRRLFERLGYDYGPDTARKNIAYYDERTSHGSTLSFVAYGGVLARLDGQASWEPFLVA